MLVLASCVMLGPMALGQEEAVFSGPQPGEKLAPFRVLGVAGPRAGEEFELMGPGAAPTLLVFVHEVTRPAMQLLRPVDLYGTKLAADGLATQFVWLSADRTQTEQFLTRAKGSLNLKSPVSISLDGIEGPGSYGLNRKVSLTILIAKDNKVVANFAIVQPNETDAPKVIGELAKLLGKPMPSIEELRNELGYGRREMPARPAATKAEGRSAQPTRDGGEPRIEDELARLRSLDQEHHARAIARVAALEKLVADLTEALNEARSKIAQLEGKPAPQPLPKPMPPAEPREAGQRRAGAARKDGAELPGRTPSDPEIIGLMRRLIQPNNDEAAVKEITEAMLKWAGDDSARKQDLKQFCVRIAHLGYGSDVAKAAIKRLAELE